MTVALKRDQRASDTARERYDTERSADQRVLSAKGYPPLRKLD